MLLSLDILIIGSAVDIVMLIVLILRLLLLLHLLVIDRDVRHVRAQLIRWVIRVIDGLLVLHIGDLSWRHLSVVCSVLLHEFICELILAQHLLLLHLLDLLLQRLLHFQAEAGNDRLLLVNVFHVQEIVDGEIELLGQVRFKSLGPLLRLGIDLVLGNLLLILKVILPGHATIRLHHLSGRLLLLMLRCQLGSTRVL